MLRLGDGGKGGVDEDEGGGILRRWEKCSEGSACGRGFSGAKSSPSWMPLKVLIGLFQSYSSKVRNAHDFSDPTLSVSSANSRTFLSIDFRLLCETPPGFLLCSI